MNSETRSHLRQLLEPIHDDARAFARRLCRHSSDGDDVFHDAVMRAARKLSDLRDASAFRAWFYRIIVSVQRSRYRRSLWRRVIPLIGSEASSTRSPLEEVDRSDGSARVREALASLSSVQREAVVLFELEGLQVEEIATIQEVSTSAVKSRLARGRRKLRTIYIKRFGMSPIGSDAELAEGTVR